jgi:RNA polymerase sigma-70 factor, ECF subfamily
MEQEADHTTAVLIDHLRAGDARARELLFQRYLPLLQRWSHGRLPGYARATNDTNDLVQITLMRALNRLDDFQSEGAGSFLAYLRRILLNVVRDEIRRSGRKGINVTLGEAHADIQNPSPVEQLVGQEELARYEKALNGLPDRQQELLILRIEFGLTFPEIAAEVNSSPDAVRMMINRATDQLAAALDQDAG